MSMSGREEFAGESTKLIEDEIHDLEEQLARAKIRLEVRTDSTQNGKSHHESVNGYHQPPAAIPKGEHPQPALAIPTACANPHPAPLQTTTTHFLLLLSDSALPLGSFAFSSGLESYLAHTRLNPFSPSSSSSTTARPLPFDLFLPLSITSYASTTLPFLLAAHRDPHLLAPLDDALDAAVVCTVGKRASCAQGRALLGLWEKSFSHSTSLPLPDPTALETLTAYAALLRAPAPADEPPPAAAHLAPLFGCVSRVLGLTLPQAAYVFVLGHVKALVSAAVRANLVGPYAAQRMLASGGVQEMIAAAVDREWDTSPEDAGQAVPVMDLWVGRHEMLYSRIFNS